MRKLLHLVQEIVEFFIIALVIGSMTGVNAMPNVHPRQTMMQIFQK